MRMQVFLRQIVSFVSALWVAANLSFRRIPLLLVSIVKIVFSADAAQRILGQNRTAPLT